MTIGKTSIETLEETIEETIEETVEETLEETMDGAIGETKETADGTAEEAFWETEEETSDDAVEGPERKNRKKVRRTPRTAIQRTHWKRIFGWLLPYFAAVVLIVCIGTAVLLITGVRTRNLSRQLQQQYGEYIADE